MKKISLVLALGLGMIFGVSAQTDILKKHTGETIEGNVVRVNEDIVVFKYKGEDAENSIGKRALANVTYGKSGRVEQMSEKIDITGPGDWDKVVILRTEAAVIGLKEVGPIKGKTGLVNFHTGNTGDRKAEEKLKKEAAKMGCPFILVTADKTTTGYNSNMIGGSQAIKKGVAFKY